MVLKSTAIAAAHEPQGGISLDSRPSRPFRLRSAVIRRAGGALGAGAGSLRRLVLALGLALALLAALPGGSALAAVAGHEIVGVPSAVNSSNKTVTASCPAGKQVVGAGG